MARRSRESLLLDVEELVTLSNCVRVPQELVETLDSLIPDLPMQEHCDVKLMLKERRVIPILT